MASQEENYGYVIDMIKKHGKPSERFKGDIDIGFGQLRELCSARIAGLQVILKQLKARGTIAFDAGAVMKEDTVVSLVGQADAELTPEHQKFESFREQFTGVTPSFR